MSDNKTVTIKTILDKTGILKGIKEAQNWMRRNPLKVSTAIDTKTAEKELKAVTDKAAKQMAQSTKLSAAATEPGQTRKTSGSSTSTASGQTQNSTSGSKVSDGLDLSALAGPGLDKLKKSLTDLISLTKTLEEIGTISNLSNAEMQELGETAYQTAGKYGKSIGDYLSSVREMADSGYENAGQMGELSTMLQSAKGISSELADSYIAASDAAYGYSGNIEKLTALLDGQNQISNKNAVSMKEMAEASLTASSEMSSGVRSISEQELSALLGTGLETSGKSGEEVGKSVSNMLTNLEKLSGSDDLRSPIEQLKELSEAYQSLPENSSERADILSDLGGGTGSDILSGILENWNIYEKMLDDYGNSSGSVMDDATAHADTLDGSLNQLANTWLDFVNNLADSSEISMAVDMLNGLVGIIDNITSVLHTSGILGAGLGAFLSSKNIGRTKSCLL